MRDLRIATAHETMRWTQLEALGYSGSSSPPALSAFRPEAANPRSSFDRRESPFHRLHFDWLIGVVWVWRVQIFQAVGGYLTIFEQQWLEGVDRRLLEG